MSLLSDIWNQQYITNPSSYKGPSPFKTGGVTTPPIIGMSPYIPVETTKSGGGYSNTQSKVTPPAPAPAPAPAYTAPQSMINPATGKLYSADEYLNNVIKKIPVGGSDIGTYAGGQITNPDQTTEQLTKTARQINNARNDISVGATDPYKVASGSGLSYSGAELAAIEKAYAGIYDPAINDVFAKLEAKQKKDDEESARKAKLEEMAIQFEYDKQLKQLDKTGGGSTSSSTGYVKGENPIVDSYVDRINNGELATDVLRGITGVDNQWLRDKVSAGIIATKYDSAKSKGSLETANMIGRLLLNPKLDNISGLIGQTGATSLWGEASAAKALYNQINSKVQLIGTAELAKGQGAISDYERSLFANAATSAKRGLSDAEFRKELVGLKSALQLASGMTASFKLTDLKTGETRTYELNRDGVIAAEKNGLVVEALDDSFSNQ